MSLNPDYPDLAYSLGVALMELGKQEKALETFEKLALKNPDDMEIRCRKGKLAMDSGSMKLPCRHSERSCLKIPNQKKPGTEKGLPCCKLERFEDAVKSL